MVPRDTRYWVDCDSAPCMQMDRLRADNETLLAVRTTTTHPNISYIADLKFDEEHTAIVSHTMYQGLVHDVLRKVFSASLHNFFACVYNTLES